MAAPNDLIAFPLLALAVMVFVAVAIAGGELVRRIVLTLFRAWMGPARPELDSGIDGPVSGTRRLPLGRQRDPGER